MTIANIGVLLFGGLLVSATTLTACSKADIAFDAMVSEPQDASDAADDGATGSGDTVPDGGSERDISGLPACVQASDCPASEDPCRVPACSAGICLFRLEPAGTVVDGQPFVSCHVSACDGAGNMVSMIDDTKVPNDGRQCTQDVCQNGVPSNLPVTAGTTCTDNGGDRCSAQGDCILNQTFFVVRIGDGATPLTSAAAPVFLEEQRLDGTVLRVLPIPSGATGQNHRFVDSGIAKSDGALARSADRHYVTLAGYDAALGTPSIVRSPVATVARVVARIDAAGNVDTSTTISNAFDGDNVRAAVTVEGSLFWVGGSNTGGSGIVEIALGGTLASSIASNLANARALQIASGQLYGSSGNAPFNNIFAVGTGVPSMTSTVTSIPAAFGASESPYGFAFLDLSGSIPGSDVLYIADERAPAMGGGIQKWKFDGTTWTLNMTFGSTGFRGVAAVAKGTNVWLLAATADPNGSNNLVAFVDDDKGVPHSIAGASVDGMSKVFRGVALAPE